MKDNQDFILLVDFKYSGSNSNITEYGCGINSDYSGYDAAHRKEPLSALDKLYLKTCGEQVPEDPPQEALLYIKIYKKLLERYDHLYLFDIQGNQQIRSTLVGLNNYTLVFAFEPKCFESVEVVLPEEVWEAIKTHGEKACIVIPGRDSDICMEYAIKVDEYCAKKQIKTPVINSARQILALAEDKAFFTYLKGQSDTHLFSLESSNLHEMATNESKVIKPTDKTGGQGVFVTKDLQNSVNQIKKWQANSKALEIPGIFKGINYWQYKPSNGFFLVEPFYQGIKIDDREATGRIVFIVSINSTGTQVEFVDGYWKLAPKGEVISDVKKDDGSRAFTSEQKTSIQESLEPQIIEIINTAFSKTLVEHLQGATGIFADYSKKVLQNRFDFSLDLVTFSNEASPSQEKLGIEPPGKIPGKAMGEN